MKGEDEHDRKHLQKASAYQGQLILLIDSDSARVAVIKKLLEDQKNVIHVASSCEEAFSLLSEAALSDMNGQQFTKQVRLRFGRAALPSVLD